MTNFPKVGIGHDVPLVSLVDVLAAHDPVAPVDRQYSVSGSVNDLGFYTCFHFGFAEDGEAYDEDILSLFFLDTSNGENNSYPVTVYVRNTRMRWQRFNGNAQLPEMGQDARWENFFPRAISIYVVDLEPLDD